MDIKFAHSIFRLTTLQSLVLGQVLQGGLTKFGLIFEEMNYKHVSDYEEKANHFNKFFASQCAPIDNDSQIPDSLVFNTEARFSSITCENNDILKIIRNLDISKAHGFDDISIRMVKLCDDSLVKPLSIIFKNCINSGLFSR